MLIHFDADSIVSAHSRWVCPEPRNPGTGLKGPQICDVDTDDFDSGDIQDVAPGPLTVHFEESVAHRGAPWRISLSGDGTDDVDQSCLLLDHIPHDEDSNPTFRADSTYHDLYITIQIPDISCEKCSLQLANPMTDKIGSDGAPNGQGCTDPFGSCFSVYYSCTKAFRITGSSSAPRSSYPCPGQPSDWPTQVRKTPS